MHYWNVTYKNRDEADFIEVMNRIRPGSYNIKYIGSWEPWLDSSSTTMIELTEEEALLVGLSVNIKVERIE